MFNLLCVVSASMRYRRRWRAALGRSRAESSSRADSGSWPLMRGSAGGWLRAGTGCSGLYFTYGNLAECCFCFCLSLSIDYCCYLFHFSVTFILSHNYLLACVDLVIATLHSARSSSAYLFSLSSSVTYIVQGSIFPPLNTKMVSPKLFASNSLTVGSDPT